MAINDYETQVGIHLRIVALYSIVREKAIWFRSSTLPDRSVPLAISTASTYTVVNRDRVVCAIVEKVANLKESLKVLCDHQQGHAALIIARTILEATVMLEWLLKKNSVQRLDTYCLFMAVNKKRWAELVLKYDIGDAATAAQAAEHLGGITDDISSSVFRGKWRTWAMFPNENGKIAEVKIADMFADCGPAMKMLHDLFYFEASQHVHTAPPSVAENARAAARETYFHVQIKPQPSDVAQAMMMSNMAMLSLLDEFDKYAGVGFGEQLKSIWSIWAGFSKTATAVSVDPLVEDT